MGQEVLYQFSEPMQVCTVKTHRSIEPQAKLMINGYHLQAAIYKKDCYVVGNKNSNNGKDSLTRMTCSKDSQKLQ